MIRPSVILVTVALGALGPGSPRADADTQKPSPPPATAPAPEAQPAGPRGDLVARVNGVPIYKIDFDSAVENFIKSQGLAGHINEEQTRQVNEVVMDGLIGSELLHQKAQAIPIEVSSEEIAQTVRQTRESLGEEGFQAELTRRRMTETDLTRLVRQNLMVQKLIQDIIVSRVDVTENEIKSFYDQHQGDMKKPERVEASHILVKASSSDPDEKRAEARKRIEEAERRAQSGEDFAVLAKEFSEDGTASSGGRLGAIQRGQTVPAFEDAAFDLEVGQVSKVVESPYGYHIIKVTGREGGSQATLDEAHDTIAQFLKQKKAQDAIEEMVQSLRTQAKVEVF
ncbi:MAG: peptidylprolyl isomerase [Candidatus Polarisedimenticolia bacterium]